MRFIDEVKVTVIGGDGGSGVVHWRREKFIPQGGPDGGDGGSGGAVIFQANTRVSTLLECSLSPTIKAQAGQAGGENNKTGKDGEDVLRQVPVGTQVFFQDRMIADLSHPGATWIAARGGRGGKGNAFFCSANNQAPDYAQPGRAGEKHLLRLVLKSVADIGLVGLPNVGKSSLVAAISQAHPLVADYPFTTLTPTLGVVELDKERRFVIADIPGLIEGAHQGKGLGVRFLQHIERTSVLVHLIDVYQDQQINQKLASESEITAEDLQRAVEAQVSLINKELSSFSETLLPRLRVVVFSKCDLELQLKAFHLAQKSLEGAGFSCLAVSTRTRTGLEEIKHLLWQKLGK